MWNFAGAIHIKLLDHVANRLWSDRGDLPANIAGTRVLSTLPYVGIDADERRRATPWRVHVRPVQNTQTQRHDARLPPWGESTAALHQGAWQHTKRPWATYPRWHDRTRCACSGIYLTQPIKIRFGAVVFLRCGVVDKRHTRVFFLWDTLRENCRRNSQTRVSLVPEYIAATRGHLRNNFLKFLRFEWDYCIFNRSSILTYISRLICNSSPDIVSNWSIDCLAFRRCTMFSHPTSLWFVKESIHSPSKIVS